jgi:hypothetical protein
MKAVLISGGEASKKLAELEINEYESKLKAVRELREQFEFYKKNSKVKYENN